MSTVVFLHAHPDDEAIFTGGTMRLLADRGDRVVLVLATSGEHGVVADHESIGAGLGARRRDETATAASILGIADVLTLGFEDSGMDGENLRGFAHQPVESAAQRVVEVMGETGIQADAIVVYDEGGIYDHPDHLMIHRVGHAAATSLGIATVYDATVDREYLHFVETHLVVEAGLDERPTDLGLASTSIGLPTLLIDIELDISAAADAKRAAMAAHESQIPETSSALLLASRLFTDVYGYEWFARHGPRGPIDTLAT